MSEKKSKVEVIRRKGRSFRLRFDYGKEIGVTFGTDKSEEEIKEEIKYLYEKHKKPKEDIKIDKVDW